MKISNSKGGQVINISFERSRQKKYFVESFKSLCWPHPKWRRSHFVSIKSVVTQCIFKTTGTMYI